MLSGRHFRSSTAYAYNPKMSLISSKLKMAQVGQKEPMSTRENSTTNLVSRRFFLGVGVAGLGHVAAAALPMNVPKDLRRLVLALGN